ncbi:DUF6907 domain-containing protein [Micromonospora rubida]
MDTQTQAPCPPWCPAGTCEADKADGSVFHMSDRTDVPAGDGGDLVDVALCRLDDEDATGEATVNVHVGSGAGIGRAADFTPGQALAFVETLRAHALTAAGPDGLDMPVEQVRLGEQIHVAGRWETVELLTVDGWCCGTPPTPGHRVRVLVGTDAHDDDADAYEYAQGDLVRVRQAVAA